MNYKIRGRFFGPFILRNCEFSVRSGRLKCRFHCGGLTALWYSSVNNPKRNRDDRVYLTSNCYAKRDRAEITTCSGTSLYRSSSSSDYFFAPDRLKPIFCICSIFEWRRGITTPWPGKNSHLKGFNAVFRIIAAIFKTAVFE